MKKKFNSEVNKQGDKQGDKRLIIASVVGVFIAIIIIAIMYMGKASKEEVVEEINTTAVDTVVKDMAFKATRNIGVGESLQSTDFEQIELEVDQVSSNLVKDIKEINGKVAKNDIRVGEQLVRDNLLLKSEYEEGDRFIEIALVDGVIPSTIAENEIIGTIIDVRLFLPGAEDKIVLSKQTIVAKSGNNLGFYLNPTEIENIKEAPIEGSLYIAVYPNENENESDITYIPGYRLGVETPVQNESEQ